MKISLKNKPSSYFSNSPGIVLACMFIITVLLVIVGASQKEVAIIDDAEKKEVITYKGTIREVLEQNEIELNSKDKISPGLESIVKDGTNICIKRAVPLTVAIDGSVLHFLSSEDTIHDVLAAEGISYGKIDKIYPEEDTIISKDLQVRVVRVTEREITEKQEIAFQKEIKEMSEWERGVDKTLTEGSNGEKVKTIKITYEDGVEKIREIMEEKITKPPVNNLVAVGTLDSIVVSRGDTIKFDKMIVMKATSYTDDIASTGQIGGTTYTGTKPRRNSDGGKWSTVAVDPRVIPLGTKLWVEGYGYAIAEDIGGAVKGNIIDLFFTNGTSEYERWSTHKTRVYILT